MTLWHADLRIDNKTNLCKISMKEYLNSFIKTLMNILKAIIDQ